MQPQDWLNQFLSDKQKDGRPLYRYKLSNAELATLETVLEINTSAINNIPGWNAVFVFYAAVWWRRNYEGGTYSWESIFASFDSNLNAEQCNLIVESGLKFWQRPVRTVNGRSSYLGTIAYESGLTAQQLHKVGYWLSELLKAAVPKYLRLQNASMLDAMRIIYACTDKHIAGYDQNHVIYTQLADIVYIVGQLKNAFQLSSKTDPVDYLNQQLSNWQELFPLPIHQPLAQALVTDLIHVAVQANEPPTPFRGRRILADIQRAHLSLVFEFAAIIDLTELIGSERVADFPVSVDVDIIGDDGNCIYVGVALKATIEHKVVLKMPCYSLPALQTNITQAYRLRFRHLSHTLAEQLLVVAIDDTLPWTFVADHDEWRLVGTASVSTRAAKVYILYPNQLSCSATRMTELTSVDGKKLIAASGVIELFDTNGQRFCIQTAQNQATPLYYLQGKTLAFSSAPEIVYLGTPELWCINSETHGKHLVNTALLAKAINSKSAPKALTTQQGIYQLLLQDEQGNTQFCQTCALLPENFALRFFDGRIDIEHSDRAYISCDSPLVTHINAKADSRSIEFNLHETAPDHVDLKLRWLKSDNLSISVPFPIHAAQLIDGKGNELSQVVINQLQGVRLRLSGENKISLKFCLTDKTITDHEIYFYDDIHYTDATFELALQDYQRWLDELLAIGDYPDSYVRLTVYQQGEEILRAHIIRTPQLISSRTRRVRAIYEINSLNDALSIQNDSLRLLFTRHRLKQLSLDFSACDWDNLRKLQSDQPLTDHEIWTAACLDNRVLAALVCQLDSAFMQRFTVELFVCWELIAISDWLVIFCRYKNYLTTVMTDAEAIELLHARIDKISQLAPSINIIVKLLKVHLCEVVDEELLFMQTVDSRPVITEQIEHEQQQLIERHRNSSWLNFLPAELKKLPPETQGLLSSNSANSVTRLPLLLAHFSLTSIPSIWHQATVDCFKLRQLKAFDERWFTHAFTLSLSYLSQQTNYIQSLLPETDTMMNSDENDLIAEIEQQLAQATQEVQDLDADVQTYKGNQKELDTMRTENADLLSTVEQLNTMINKRDTALKRLLTEVSKLNGQIREIRSELQTKS